MRKSALLLLALSAFLLSTGATLRDLGSFPGGGLSVAHQINSTGAVVGYAFNAAGIQRAVLWKGGYMHEIPTPAISGGVSEAHDLNEDAYVVGRMATGVAPSRAFLWCLGCPLRDLGAASTNQSLGYGINNARDVVGQWTIPGAPPQYRAAKWIGGATPWTDMGGLGGLRDYADKITDVGRAAGTSANTARNSRAVLWEGKKVIDLGTLGGTNSWGRNLVVISWPDPYFLGTYVVGESEVVPGSLNTHAFVWNGWTMTDLGTLPGWYGSRAYGINKDRVIVGQAWDSYGGGLHHAVMWVGGTIIDLNSLHGDPEWELICAFDINDAGEIVGYGIHKGEGRAFVFKP